MRVLPFFVILSVLISLTAVASSDGSGIRTRSIKYKRPMKTKLTKFRVYWQDKLSSPNPTSIRIVQPPLSKATSPPSFASFFGATQMIDNALTLRSDRNSTVVGRAQGFYAAASLAPPLSFLMAMNFAFTGGKFNGSSITLMGSNPALSEVRELPVVGGSGIFRFARGYALLSTRWLDLSTGDATVEYKVFVLHY